MSDLAERAQRAIAQTRAVVDRVCGACGNSCCHQGTMVGTRDVQRLVKGIWLEPDREAILREGLRERALELRADLETLQVVRRLLASSAVAEEAQIAKLEHLIGEWESLCQTLEGPWQPEVAALRDMLRYAGIRALTLRLLAGVPGGHSALSRMARPGSSFRFRGRKIAPPRCLFHHPERGCLAGPWKPGKCANFFCAGDPNLLRELRREMAFDDFVLGNARVVTPSEAVRAVELELRLGPEFVEPKVFLGASTSSLQAIYSVLQSLYRSVVQVDDGAERFMQSTAEVDRIISNLDRDEVAYAHCATVDGAALYELAVAFDRRRAEGEAVAFVVAADEYAPSSALPHPLWADEQMSQPLGVLDLYVVDERTGPDSA